jgi:hypothetical protein
VAVLRQHTATPDDCTLALWDGFGYGPVHPVVGRLSVPKRAYHLADCVAALLATAGIEALPAVPGDPVGFDADRVNPAPSRF